MPENSDINNKIVDLNTKFKPRIGIIDGVIGCQTHEIACDPVPSDLIVAGTDVV